MNVLALDIATKTGWAHQDSVTATPTFGVAEFPKTLAEFASAFETWLKGKIAAHKPDLVAVEAPVPVRGTTTLDIQLRTYGAHAIARMICLRAGIALTSINVGQWRKFFIGQARAPKEENGVVLKPAHRRRWIKKATIAKCVSLGWPVKSDDAADALGVLAYVRAHAVERDAA